MTIAPERTERMDSREDIDPDRPWVTIVHNDPVNLKCLPPHAGRLTPLPSYQGWCDAAEWLREVRLDSGICDSRARADVSQLRHSSAHKSVVDALLDEADVQATRAYEAALSFDRFIGFGLAGSTGLTALAVNSGERLRLTVGPVFLLVIALWATRLPTEGRLRGGYVRWIEEELDKTYRVPVRQWEHSFVPLFHNATITRYFPFINLVIIVASMSAGLRVITYDGDLSARLAGAGALVFALVLLSILVQAGKDHRDAREQGYDVAKARHEWLKARYAQGGDHVARSADA